MTEKKKRGSLSAFSILMLILLVLCIVSAVLSGSPISDSVIKNLDPERYGSLLEILEQGNHVEVVGAGIKDFFMSIPNGFMDASDLIVFIFCIGGFIGIVMETGALQAGVLHLVKKMKGKEERLIVILMFLFSLGGTTYGMAEETIGFYALITTAMVAAGFDTLVALSTVLIGATSGVLGSTINPFATGVAMSALKSVGIEPNVTLIMGLGVLLWLSTYAIAAWYVTSYAKKVKADKGSTLLTVREQQIMEEELGEEAAKAAELEFTGKHKAILTVFGISFIVMIISLISWPDLVFGGDEDAFLAAMGWTDFLTGEPLGWWYFTQLAAWFTFASIIVAVIAGFSEKHFINSFLAGAADLISVALIIATARGITVVMNATHMDFWILDKSAQLLSGVPALVFIPLAYIIYLILSFLVPSTSGLAGLSIPVMGPLAAELGFNPTIMIMVFSAACGVINYFTPTSGVVMGGVAASRVEYSTYLKFVWKFLIIVGIANIVILTAAEMMS